MSHETFPSPTLDTNETDNPEYAPEKLQGIDQAAAGAIYILKDGNGRKGVSETDKGLREVTTGSIPGGNVEGQAEHGVLKDIYINLQGEDGEHTVQIENPESSHPIIYLDGQPATAEDMPSVVGVIEQIKAERQAQREAGELPPADSEEDEDSDSNNPNQKMAA